MKPETQKALKVGALGVGANILGTAGFLEVESLFDNSHTSVGLAMGILTAATIFGLSYFAGYIAEESNPRHRGFHMDAVGIINTVSILGAGFISEITRNIVPSLLVTAIPLAMGSLSTRPRRDRKYYYDKED